MNRIWGHLITGAIACGSITVLTAACAHDDSTIFIRQLSAPPLAVTGGVCTYTADAQTPGLPSGTLDVGLLSTYTGVAVVGNQLIARADPNTPKTETNRVELLGAVVRLTDAAGASLADFTSLGSGFADPASGTAPGFGLIGVTLVDGKTAESLRGGIAPLATRRVVANFKVFGKTLGGVDVESQEYAFPIDVCNGCLVRFPPDSVDKALQAAQGGKLNCAGTGSGTSTVAPCVIGQDQPVDCRLCQGQPACNPG